MPVPVRRFFSMVKVSALEALSEPLALLLTLSAMTMAALVPAMHYHQFGESTRMARDAGFSALFMFGAAYAIFLPIKGMRREIESGTASIALAHGVSRKMFFLAKATGVYVAFLIFACTLTALSLTAINGAGIGGKIALRTGEIAKMWGPSLSWAMTAIVASPIIGALANRFLGWRFVPASTIFALIISIVSAAYRFDASMALRLMPGFLVLAVPPAVFVFLSSAFAARLRANAAVSASVFAFALSLPIMGNYYLSDAFADGRTIACKYAVLAILAAIPLAVAAAMAGIAFLEGRDISGGR